MPGGEVLLDCLSGVQVGEGDSVSARRVDFEAPPVVETTLGVLFAPIPGWNLLHYGVLWQESLRDKYVNAAIKAPTGPVEASEVLTQNEEQVDLGMLPVRCRYTNADQTQLLHIQRNAFSRHWRATAECPEYQHYDTFKPIFKSDWEIYTAFLARHTLPVPAVWQWQVTYINHLVRGREWQSLTEIRELFPAMHNTQFGSGRWAQMLLGSFALSYSIPNSDASLEIVANPGIRQSDQKEIVQLSLCATGKPGGSDTSAILQGFDLGHDAIVENFRDFTAPRLHKIWGIQ
jgi:uncharacterized protein (TIGR04255 family)